jgi:hypothetical protein
MLYFVDRASVDRAFVDRASVDRESRHKFLLITNLMHFFFYLFLLTGIPSVTYTD